MKTLCLSASLFMVFFLFVNPNVSTAGEISGPRLVLEERIFEHEAVEQGEVIEHTFLVHNLGDETLEIKKVVPG